MALSSASVPVGATYTPSGGTATSFISMGKTLNQNKLYIDDSPTSLALRKTALATVKPPVVSSDAPNGFTQQRSSISFHVPLLLDNGEYTTNKVEVSISYDVETSAAELQYLRDLVIFTGADADFDGLFDGSID
jgi:hypothetical protein